MIKKALFSLFGQKNHNHNIKFNSGSLASHRITEDNSDRIPFDFNEANYKEIEVILKKYPVKS